LNDIVIPLGDDVSIPNISAFITGVEWAFSSSKAPIVGFCVIDKYQSLKIPRVLQTLMWELCGQLYPERGSVERIDYNMFTCAFAFDRNQLHKRFDEGYRGSGFNADVDFMLGEKVHYVPTLKVYHDYEFDPIKRPLMAANRRRFLQKRFRFWRLRLLFYLYYLWMFSLVERRLFP
jgi:hypothetical protein